MPTQKIKFQNKEGQSLAARLEMPVDKKPLTYAIFAHCFTCSKNLNAVTHISRALMQQGIAVFRFDFTGLGESEGDFSNTSFSSNVDDLISAANFLRQNYEAPQLLIGHSLGGAAVLAASLLLKEVRAVATLGAPASPMHVKYIFDKSIEQISQDGEAKVSIGERSFKIKNQFIEEISKDHLKEKLKKLKKALLIMHSPQDQVVGIENATEIYKSAMHPKSFISLDGTDHLLSNAEDSIYAGNMIAVWSQRYLKFPKDEVDKLTTDKQVVVRTKSSYTTEIKAGQHHLTADEPEAVGGNNLGPDPYGLLLASLGACTGITLRMYANRKKWPLTEVNVHLEHSKVYQEDCMHCDDKEQKIDNIDRILELEGGLSDVQRNKLLEIADKCPVHKTLSTQTDIKTTLKEQKNSRQ